MHQHIYIYIQKHTRCTTHHHVRHTRKDQQAYTTVPSWAAGESVDRGVAEWSGAGHCRTVRPLRGPRYRVASCKNGQAMDVDLYVCCTEEYTVQSMKHEPAVAFSLDLSLQDHAGTHIPKNTHQFISIRAHKIGFANLWDAKTLIILLQIAGMTILFGT
jgi:hypothetical protein